MKKGLDRNTGTAAAIAIVVLTLVYIAGFAGGTPTPISSGAEPAPIGEDGGEER